jgi:hypothetical protein
MKPTKMNLVPRSFFVGYLLAAFAIDAGATPLPANGTVAALHDSSFPRKSEQSFEILENGDILMMYGAHSGSGDLDKAVIQSILSSDGGATWSAPTTTFSDSFYSVFQPSLLTLDNGELVATLTYLQPNTQNNAQKMFSRFESATQNWSTPVQISDDQYAYNTGAHDRLRQLESGRILSQNHVLRSVPGAKELGTYYSYSDDHGTTWQRGPAASVQDGSFTDLLFTSADTLANNYERGCWEADVVEHSPAQLLIMARTAAGVFYQSRSSDSGTTWSAPEPSQVPNPMAPAYLTKVPNSETVVLLQNPHVQTVDTASNLGGSRTQLAYRFTDDGGQTWWGYGELENSADDSRWYDYPSVRWDGTEMLVAYRGIDRAASSGGFQTVDVLFQRLAKTTLLAMPVVFRQQAVWQRVNGNGGLRGGKVEQDGQLAWSIISDGVAGKRTFFKAAVDSLANPGGIRDGDWRLEMDLEVVGANRDPAGNAVYVSYVAAGREWAVRYGSDSAGHMIVQLRNDSDNPTVTLSSGGYHSLSLRFDHTSQKAALFLGDQMLLQNYTGIPKNAAFGSETFVRFGVVSSGASGEGRYRNVSLIGEKLREPEVSLLIETGVATVSWQADSRLVYCVEKSADLLHWSELETFENMAGAMARSYPIEANEERAFYRLHYGWETL